MTIGERIRDRRKELGYTQIELAYRMGYKNKSAICNVEKNGNNITSDRVVKFAEALDCTPAYLMGWADIDDNPITQPTIASKIGSLIAKNDKSFSKLIDIYLSIPPNKRPKFVDYLKQSAELFRN